MTQTDFDPIAQYYDYLFPEKDDIPFWVKLAKKFGSPVLEFACGTGRITFPIAQAGIEITGIDISINMLQKAKEKLAKEPEEIRKKVTLIQADCNNFNLPNKNFSAVFSPWGFYAVTNNDERDCLNSVKKHLNAKGYFVVDIRNEKEPAKDWDIKRVEEEEEFPELKIKRESHVIGNAKTKIFKLIYQTKVMFSDRSVKEIITERKQKLYTKKDMEKLLENSGFKILEIYGDYDFSDYQTDSKRAIFISR